MIAPNTRLSTQRTVTNSQQNPECLGALAGQTEACVMAYEVLPGLVPRPYRRGQEDNLAPGRPHACGFKGPTLVVVSSSSKRRERGESEREGGESGREGCESGREGGESGREGGESRREGGGDAVEVRDKPPLRNRQRSSASRASSAATVEATVGGEGRRARWRGGRRRAKRW